MTRLSRRRLSYLSSLLSKGENPWWVATQMGHENIEMILRHYGKWIPDRSVVGGYATAADWAAEWRAMERAS